MPPRYYRTIIIDAGLMLRMHARAGGKPGCRGWALAPPADPGQRPRGAPCLVPPWAVPNSTTEGRGKDWYPSFSYAEA